MKRTISLSNLESLAPSKLDTIILGGKGEIRLPKKTDLHFKSACSSDNSCIAEKTDEDANEYRLLINHGKVLDCKYIYSTEAVQSLMLHQGQCLLIR